MENMRNPNKDEPPVVTSQPTSRTGHGGSSPVPERPTIIAMPPPPSSAGQDRSTPSPSREYDERVPLKTAPTPPRQSPTKTGAATQKSNEWKPHVGTFDDTINSSSFVYGSTSESDTSRATVREN